MSSEQLGENSQQPDPSGENLADPILILHEIDPRKLKGYRWAVKCGLYNEFPENENIYEGELENPVMTSTPSNDFRSSSRKPTEEDQAGFLQYLIEIGRIKTN